MSIEKVAGVQAVDGAPVRASRRAKLFAFFAGIGVLGWLIIGGSSLFVLAVVASAGY